MKGSRIQFPQELVDHTIDHLHDDLLTLCNCSLVCHSWTPSSQLHLFSTIRLREPPRHNSDNPLHKPCQRLYRFLTDSPYIIPYIKGLLICEGSKLPGFSSTSWILTESTLPLLLVKLTHLQRLELHATGPVTWNALPNNLRDAIRALFCYSPLAYVQFNSWIFPKIADFASLLSACPTLKGLALRLCTIGSADVDTFLESERDTDRGCTQRAQLEFLTVDYMDLTHLAGWLISPQATVDISLRELRVAYSNDTPPIQKLLQAVDSIEHCHLNPRGRPGEPVPHPCYHGFLKSSFIFSWVTRHQPQFKAPFYPFDPGWWSRCHHLVDDTTLQYQSI